MLRRDLIKFASVALRQMPAKAGSTIPMMAAVSQPTSEFSTSLALARSKFRHSRHHIPVLFELWRRREEVGPEKPKHRSEFPNWNYEAELFAFCKRLGEEWKRETLIEAFTEKSYAEAEAHRRANLSAKASSKDGENSDVPAVKTGSVLSNAGLASKGEEICRSYITAFLQHALPNYPCDGVKFVCDFLLSDESLALVCKNMGTSDLILSTEFPPATSVLANVMKALVGGLERDQGAKRAYYFVHDFIVTQLSGRDINQFWQIINPMGLLAETMKRPIEKGGSDSPGEPEPRIIWQTGVSTPLAAYKVGIYDSVTKKLMGQGGGETPLIAEQMAALDALYRLFGTHEWRLPFEFGREARSNGVVENIGKGL